MRAVLTVATLPAERRGAAALALEARAPNTRRAYRAALARLDSFLAGRALTDATLAAHVRALAAAAFFARVFGGRNGQSIGRRFARAALAAGIEGVTAHSGRIAHASKLTARGASTTEVMLSGGQAAQCEHEPPPPSGRRIV